MNDRQRKPKRDMMDIIRCAIESVDPERAINTHVHLTGETLTVCGCTIELSMYHRIYVIGAGKASARMAEALERILSGRITGGVVSVVKDQPIRLKCLEVIEAEHPLPGEGSLQAAAKSLKLMQSLGENDLVLCLISGGASALWSLPAGGINLDDKICTTELLLRSGADIHEINTVRKHLSSIKGGRLAQAVSPACLVTLLISDVVGDQLSSIGSGPTVADPTTFDDAWSVVRKYNLTKRLPKSVLAYLHGGVEGNVPETPKPHNPIFTRNTECIIASNRQALEAAAERGKLFGYNTRIISTEITGEARVVGKNLVEQCHTLMSKEGTIAPPALFLSGGETTVTVKGKGRGGRNQELVLAAALVIDGWENTVVASIGTDGIDGATDAAGAFADGSTVERGRAVGMNARNYLKDNNSFTFFERIGDLIRTGPTGTNVMDIQLFVFL